MTDKQDTTQTAPQSPATEAAPQSPAIGATPQSPATKTASQPPAGKTVPPSPPMTLEQRLAKVYADRIMTTSEFMALRDEADRQFALMIKQLPGNGYMGLFQQMADVAVQAMQLGILDIKKARPSADIKTLVKEAYGFQVAYIKACLDRMTQAL